MRIIRGPKWVELNNDKHTNAQRRWFIGFAWSPRDGGRDTFTKAPVHGGAIYGLHCPWFSIYWGGWYAG